MDKEPYPSSLLFYAALVSIIASIWIYFQMDPQLGIFIGLWAPTLMTISNRYK